MSQSTAPILIDVSLPTPEENLALDEALLLQCEGAAERGETLEMLRFWESSTPFVVLGVAGKLHREVHVDRCLQDGVPILRRASGGGTVLEGPGCLNYGFTLSLERHAELRDIHASYRALSHRIAAAIAVDGVSFRGTSDLSVGDLKFSGNAQKRKRRTVLHHGTVLYDFDLSLIGRYLKEPERQPEYRRRRSHEAFVTNLELAAAQIKERIRAAWNTRPPPGGWELPEVRELVEEKYGNPEWTERF